MGLLDILAAPFNAIQDSVDTAQYGRGWQQRQQMEADALARAKAEQDQQLQNQKVSNVTARLNAIRQATENASKDAYDGAQTVTAPVTPFMEYGAVPPLPNKTETKITVPPGSLEQLSALGMSPAQLDAIRSGIVGNVKRTKAKESADALKAEDAHRKAAQEDQKTQAQMLLLMRKATEGPAKNYNDQIIFDQQGKAYFVDPRTHKMTPVNTGAAGIEGNISKSPLSDKAQETRASVASLFQNLNEMSTIVKRNPGAVGFGSTQMTGLQSKLSTAPGAKFMRENAPGIAGRAFQAPDPDRVAVRAAAAAANAEKAHEIFGSRLTAPEQVVLAKFQPDPNTDDQTFLAQTRRYQQEILKRAKYLHMSPQELGMNVDYSQVPDWRPGQATPPGQPAPTPTPAAPGSGAPAIGTQKQFPNGKVGVWDGKGWVAQ